MWWCLENLAKIAPLGTFFVALAAFLLACCTLWSNRGAHRESVATQNFRDLMKLFIDKPEFANGRYVEMDVGKKEKYFWFVGYMLWTFERLIDVYEKDTDWKKNIMSLIERHKEYLGSSDFQRERKFYDIKLIRLIDDVLEVPA